MKRGDRFSGLLRRYIDQMPDNYACLNASIIQDVLVNPINSLHISLNVLRGYK